MDQFRFNLIIDDTICAIKQLADLKGREYAGEVDRLRNFRSEASSMNIPMELVWHIYAQKHWDAITTYVKDIVAQDNSRPRSEPIEGRLDDLIVYAILMKAIIQENKMPKENPITEPVAHRAEIVKGLGRGRASKSG